MISKVALEWLSSTDKNVHLIFKKWLSFTIYPALSKFTSDLSQTQKALLACAEEEKSYALI